MNYILFDDYSWDNLLPLTFTRPTSELRIGILTIKEKWEKYLNQSCSYITKDYLSDKFPLNQEEYNILINGSIIPNKPLFKEIEELKPGQTLVKDNDIIAGYLEKQEIEAFRNKELRDIEIKEFKGELLKINYPWQIFQYNGEAIKHDFNLLTEGRTSAPLSETNRVTGSDNIFIEEGAVVEFATLNTTKGPVYIGKDAEIMENSSIRGPFAMCEHAVVKMGAKIYGPTTIGPYSKAGGEINNSVFWGYSNKAHDGFLGNAVIGQWCNLGADTNNSNLKNNYAQVKLWNYVEERFLKTSLQFCGLIMGDHSKCGINTMFNTGTVVGVNANIFGEGFPRNFIPSFAWGGTKGFQVYKLNKALQVAETVMKRRDIVLDDTEKKILTEIYNITEKYRNF
jgi:UDP-N-acetylglucosamine diphosphorylase/glucosamine-1-phosphate N-acetyltransferase